MSFVQVIDIIFPIYLILSAVVFLVIWISAMISLLNSNRTLFFRMFVVGAAILTPNFLTSSYVVSEAQNEVNKLLLSEIVSIHIDGATSSHANQWLFDLRHLDTSFSRYHQSHPIRTITVLLQTKKGDLELKLGRDSDNPQEYWVFYPHFITTSYNDIGKIVTTSLDSYLGSEAAN